MVGDVVDRAPSFPDEACDSCMVEPASHEKVDKEVTCVHGFFILPLGKYLFGRNFRFLRMIFHSKTLQRMFSSLHPRWSIDFGLEWAKNSRLKRENGGEPPYMGENKEPLVLLYSAVS